MVMQPTERAVRRSVQDVPAATLDNVGTPSWSDAESELHLFSVAQFADEILPWGTSVRERDKQLREFLPTESLLLSTVGTVAARNAAMSFKLDGGPRQVDQAQRMLQEAQFGEGWRSFVIRLTIDLMSQSNGAFIETVRETDSPSARVIGLATMDARRCIRTGDPRAPVLYEDDKGQRHLMAWWEAFPLAEMPSNIERLRGIQYCFLDRVLRAAQLFRDITQFQREKMGGRRPRAVHFVSGTSQEKIADALVKLKSAQDNLGQYRYSDPLIVTNLAADKPVTTATIELASLPEGFDAAEAFRQYVAFLAVAALVDYQEIAPLPGGNLGTSSQSEVQHRKARGKGPALFQKLIEDRFNFYGVVGNGVTFAFDEQDFAAQLEEANVKLARANRLSLLVEKGIIPSAIARQIMADEGDLDEEYMAMMAEQDATPDVTVSDTETAESVAADTSAAERVPIIGAPATPPLTEPPPQAMQGLRAKREPTPRELDHAAVMDGVEDEMRGRMETALDAARKRFLAAVKREAPATSPAVEAVKALSEAIPMMGEQIAMALEGMRPAPALPPPPVVEAVEVLGDRIVARLERVESQVREASRPRRVTRTPVYDAKGQIVRVEESIDG